MLLNYLPREPREDGDPVKVGCAAINSNPPAALTLTKVCTPISEEIGITFYSLRVYSFQA